MAETLKVGMQLEFQGVENIKQTMAQVEKAANQVGSEVNTVFQAIDTTALVRIAGVLGRIEEAVAKIGMMFDDVDGGVKVSVQLKDGDIAKLKQALEEAVVEALTRIRNTLEDGQALIKVSGGSSKKESNPFTEAAASIKDKAGNVDTGKAGSRINDLDEEAARLKSALSSLDAALQDIESRFGNSIQDLSQAIGKRVTSGSTTFRLEASKVFDAETKLIQQRTLGLLTTLADERERVAGRIKNAFNVIKGFAKIPRADRTDEDRERLVVAREEIKLLAENDRQLKRKIQSASGLISTLESVRRVTLDGVKSTRLALDLEDRRATRINQITELMTRSRSATVTLLQSQDPQRVSQFTQQFEKLNLQINNDIKKFRQLADSYQVDSNRIQREIEKIQMEMADAAQEIDKDLAAVQSKMETLPATIKDVKAELSALGVVNFDNDSLQKTLDLISNADPKIANSQQSQDIRDFISLLGDLQDEYSQLTAQEKILKKQREQASNSSVLDNLKAQKAASDKARQSLEQDIDTFIGYTAEVKQTIASLRSLTRVFEENDRIIERVGRNNARLAFTTESVNNALQSLGRAGFSIIDPNETELAQRRLNKVKTEVEQLRNNLIELRQAGSIELSQLQGAFNRGEGKFKVDANLQGPELAAAQAEAQQAYEAIRREIEKRYETLERETLNRIESLTTAESKASQEQIQDNINVAKSYQRVLDQLDKVAEKQKIATGRATGIAAASGRIGGLPANVQDINTAGIDRAARQFAELEKEARSVENELEKINQLIELFGREGQASLDKLNAELLRLQKLALKPGIDQETAKQLDTQINEIISNINRLEVEGVQSVKSLDAEYQKLLMRQNELNQALERSGNVRVLGLDVTEIDKDLKKAVQDVNKFRNEFARTEIALNQFSDQMGEVGDKSLVAAQGIKKIGSDSKSTAAQLDQIIYFLEELQRAGVKLDDTQQQSLETARQLRDANRARGESIDKNKASLDRVEKAAKKAGNRWRLYNEQIADSIIENFKFVNSLTIVTSVLFAIRSAFTQLITESKALSRTYTVVQSEAMTFAEAQKSVQLAVRETAIEFGETIETTAEVVKQLGSAGLKAETALAGLAPIMNLIVATQGNAEEATRTVAGVYKIFGDELSVAGNKMQAFNKIADTLTTVYRNHQAELDEVNQGLRFSAAAAKAAGVPFSDLTAFIAVLNDNMIKSGAAGRGLQVVFAQLAAKSRQIEQAFGIDAIDKTLPIAQQFESILGQINAKYKTGALNVRDLDKTFKIFGLRGARTFITLVKQFDSVQVALNRFRNGTKGTAAELAGVVQKGLAKEFESAKQALLDIGREFVEPFTDIIVVAADAAKAVRDFIRSMGATGDLVKRILVISAAFVFVFQSVVALVRVFGVLTAEIFTTVKAIGSGIVSLTGYSKAADTAAASNLKLAASQKTLNKGQAANTASAVATTGALKKLSIAFRGLSLAGVAGIVIGAVVAIGVAIASTTKSARELKREFVDISNEVGGIQRNIVKIDSFVAELQRLDDKLGVTTEATSQFGQEVVNAFNAVGSELISQKDIITKTNLEIAQSFGAIAEAARIQARRVKKAQELELGQKREKLVATTSQRLNLIPDELGIDTGLLNERLKAQLDNSALGKAYFLRFKVSDKDKTRAITEAQKLINELIKVEGQLAEAGVSSARIDTFVDDFFKNLGKSFDSNVIEFLKGVRKGQLSRAYVKKAFNERDLIDPLDTTFGNLLFVVKKLDGPIGADLFGDIVDQLDVVKGELDSSIDEFKLFETAFGRVLSVFETTGIGPGGEFAVNLERSLQSLKPEDYLEINKAAQISVELDRTSRAKLTKDLFDAIPDFGQGNKGVAAGLRENLSKFLPNAGLGLDSKAVDNIAKTSERILKIRERLNKADSPAEKAKQQRKYNDELREFESSLFGIQDAAEFSGKNLSSIFFAFAQGTGNAREAFKAFTQDLRNKKLADEVKKAEEVWNDLVRGIERSIFARTKLNEIQTKDDEIQRLKELETSYKKAGLSIDNVAEKLATALKERATLIKFLQSQNQIGKKNAEEELKTVEKQISTLQEVAGTTADRIRKQKELRVILLKQRNEVEKQTRLLRNVRNNLQGNVSKAREQLDLQLMLVKAKTDELRLSERLIGSVRLSLDAIKEMLQLSQEVVKTQIEFTEALNAEVGERFKINEQIEKLLDSKNKLAGADFIILDATRKIADLNTKIAKVNTKDNKNTIEAISERTKLYKQLVDAVKPLFDLEKQLLAIEKKQNEALDKRLEILKAIRGEYRSNAKEIETSLDKILKRQFELDPTGTAIRLARGLNQTFAQVRFAPQEAIKDYIKGIREGRIATQGFGQDFNVLGNRLAGFGKDATDINDLVKKLAKQRLDNALLGVDKFLAKGKLDEAQKQLDRFRATINDVAQTDSELKIKLLFQAEEKQEEIIQRIGDEQKKLAVVLEIIGQDEFFKFLAIIKQRLAGIKSELNEINNIGTKVQQKTVINALPGIARGTEGSVGSGRFITSDQFLQVQSSLDGFAKNLETIINRLVKLRANGRDRGRKNEALRELRTLKKGIQDYDQFTKQLPVVKLREGGMPQSSNMVPGGYGGGDRIPALLEPGEYVIPKHIVARFGVDYFDKIREGKVPGFNTGGLVNGKKTRGSSSQILSNAMAALAATIDRLERTMRTTTSGLIKFVKKSSSINPAYSSMAVKKGVEGLTGVIAEGANSSLDFLRQILDSSKATEKNTDAVNKGIKKLPQARLESKKKSNEIFNIGPLKPFDFFEALQDNEKLLFGANQALLEFTSPVLKVTKFFKGLDEVGKEILLKRGNRTEGLSTGEKGQTQQAGRKRVTATEDFKKSVEAGRKILEKNPILAELVNQINKALADAFNGIQSFLRDQMIPEFAKANTEVFKGFIENLRGIEKAYREQLDTAQISLKRNETSYYAYIKSIEDAELQRIKARLAAEEQYRKELKKTSEVFEASFRSGFDSIVSGATRTLSSAFDGLTKQLFGDPKANLEAIVGDIEAVSKEIGISLLQQLPASISKAFGYIPEDLKKKAGAGIESAYNALTKTADGAAEKLVGSISDRLGKIGKNFGKLFGGLIGGSVSAGVSGIGALISGLVSVTSSDNFGDKTVQFIERFVDELPLAAEEFTTKLIENSDRLIGAVANAAPAVIDSLVEQLPRFLGSLVDTLDKQLPKIVESIVGALPQLIQGLIPKISGLLIVIIKQLPKLIGGIIEAIPVLIAEIIKQLPRLLYEVVKALVVGIYEAIKGLFKGVGKALGIFHDGGVIPGNAKDTLIIAQSGEGVLSRKGMKALGGAKRLDELNSGRNPFEGVMRAEELGLFHNGGMVGGSVSAGQPVANNSMSNGAEFIRKGNGSTYNTSLQLTVAPSFTGSETDEEIRRKSQISVEETERELARRIQDRNSPLYRVLRDR